MLPFADCHVHLLAGRDDGPPDLDTALAMCRMLVAEGARHATALAHMNPHYPDNTADVLRTAAAELTAALAREGMPLTVYPSAEVMLGPDTLPDWKAGKLLTLGDGGKYLLVEMPHNVFLDVRPLAEAVAPTGVKLVIAHAERYPELVENPGLTAATIAAGCLLQVTAEALADPPDGDTARGLKTWATRGMIHLLGSDGHGLDRRPPRMKAGVAALAKLAGPETAERVAGIWGPAVLQGQAITVPPPKPPAKKGWFGSWLG